MRVLCIARLVGGLVGGERHELPLADLGGPKLPARGHGGTTLCAPAVDEEPVFHQPAHELLDLFLCRRGPGRVSAWVVGDHIEQPAVPALFARGDLALHEGLHPFGDLCRVLAGVVDAGDQDILDHDLASAADLAELEEDVLEFLHAPFFVEGHEFVADFVVGCVEREGEAELPPAVGLDLFFDPTKPIDASDGGDGDGGHRHRGTGLIREALDGAEDFIEVVEAKQGKKIMEEDALSMIMRAEKIIALLEAE